MGVLCCVVLLSTMSTHLVLGKLLHEGYQPRGMQRCGRQVRGAELLEHLHALQGDVVTRGSGGCALGCGAFRQQRSGSVGIVLQGGGHVGIDVVLCGIDGNVCMHDSCAETSRDAQ